MKPFTRRGLIATAGALLGVLAVSSGGASSAVAATQRASSVRKGSQTASAKALGASTYAQAAPTPGAVVYIRSELGGAPWGETTNEEAMDRVFGAGNWSDLRYETVDAGSLFSPSTKFIYMEGSDDDAEDLEAFLDIHRTALESWVSAGGRLLLNAAPNEGDGMDFGFGVTLSYNFAVTHSDLVTAAVDSPIFHGPFGETGTTFTGNSFGHALVSGGGISPLIFGLDGGGGEDALALAADPIGIVLGELNYGAGHALFGGMTTTNFHDPQPQATDLRANILAYAASAVAVKTTGIVRGAGTFQRNQRRGVLSVNVRGVNPNQPLGALAYQDGAGTNFAAARITQLQISGNHALIGGITRHAGRMLQFTADIVDAGAADVVRVTLSNGYDSGEIILLRSSIQVKAGPQ